MTEDEARALGEFAHALLNDPGLPGAPCTHTFTCESLVDEHGEPVVDLRPTYTIEAA